MDAPGRTLRGGADTGGPTDDAAAADPVTGAVALATALRGAGLPVGPDRVHRFLQALGQLDATRRADVYWAGRATLCAHPEQLAIYDAVFSAFFEGRVWQAQATRTLPARRVTMLSEIPQPDTDTGDDDGREALVANASAVEVLRRRDVATLDEDERAALRRLLARFSLPGAQRRTRRLHADRRGRVDRRRTVRAMLEAGGEVAALRRRDVETRPRRVVLLIDVSGSMSPYADALLRFAHAAAGGRRRTEVFSIGTRLTRLTRELSHRDPDTAMAAVAGAIPDWSGGTQLGAGLKRFLDRWGQRGMARGAVVVVLSDGWERDDPALLGEQMARLSRLAHRVVWANPRRGRPGFAPLVGGLVAALPHVDDFVDGHSLEALEHLADVVAGRS